MDSAETSLTVSVITASLNTLADLKRTVMSVASQKCQDVEHIIVDGDSTDGTLAFLASLHGVPIRWVSEPDSGIAEAMNKAVRLAKGDYLLALQAGDTFLNDGSLAEAIRHLDGMTEIVAFVVQQVNGEKSATLNHSDLMRRLGLKLPFPHQGCFIRRKLFSRIGMFDECYRLAFDYDFEIRALRALCSIKRIPLAIARMPVGGISTLTDRKAVIRRFNEERRLQFAHSPNTAYTALLCAYWPLYLS